jgi:tetratricopeptide (TPR) repeat protein
MKYLAVFLLPLIVHEFRAQDVSPTDRVGITIILGNTRNVTMGSSTHFDAGSVVGDMLNAHYFPGLQDYGNGRYDYAEVQMSYVVDRPKYLEKNPRRGEFLSSAHYIRGMIYFYHAEGLGRLRLAKTDFEEAIKWNPKNFVAYLELSRLYYKLDKNDAAIEIVNRLLGLNPDKTITEQAHDELKRLGVETKP